MFSPEPLSIYCDTADLNEIKNFADNRAISGFTTNPSIFRAQGIENYLEAARLLVEGAYPKEVSLEVIGDDEDTMLRQAKALRALGDNTYIKIPITNTLGSSTSRVVQALMEDGIPVNLTAVFALKQIQHLYQFSGTYDTPIIISVFAGRIADAGQDPEQAITQFVDMKSNIGSNCRILWASPREVFNVIQAKRCGCDIITLTPQLISKMNSFGKNLEEFSLETVKMFASDATKSGYSF